MKYSVGIILLLALVGFNSCKKKGCTDYLASNYQENNAKEDGSCFYGDTPEIRGEYGSNNVLDTFVVYNASGGQYDMSKWYIGYEQNNDVNLLVFQFSDDFYFPNDTALYMNYDVLGITHDATTFLYLVDSTGFLIDEWQEPEE